MNALLEKLFTDINPDVFQETVNEIQKQSEAAPEAWQADLNAALERARMESIEARAKFNEAEEEAERAEAFCLDNARKFNEDEPEAQRYKRAMTEAKARAWDLYWDDQRAARVTHEIYDLAGNVAYLLVRAAETDNPAPDELQERQASPLSELCDHIRPRVENDGALLSALIAQLTDWHNDLPADERTPF